MAHLAFQRHPTQHLGVLSAKDFSPLTLQGVIVDAEVRDTSARVQVTYEYKNCFSSAQSVFVAFPQIPGWTVASIRSEGSNGGTARQWVKTLAGSGGDAPSQPESETFLPSVITQAIPWELLGHEFVVATAIYYAPMEWMSNESKSRLTIPRRLFPVRVDVEETARSYNSHFEIKGISNGKLARTVYMHVHGSLMDSLSKPPVIIAGENAVGQCNKNTFSAKWESHAKDLFVAEDLIFEAEVVRDGQPLAVSLWQDISSNPNTCAADAKAACIPVEYGLAGTISVAPVLTTEQLASPPNDEIIFLIDASASMLPHWSEVLRAVKLAVASLPPTTYVNVVWYSTHPEFLFPNGSELLTQAVRDLIIEDLLGYTLRAPTNAGTKLYQALQAIYKQPYFTGFVRHIVLLTDSGAEEHLALRTTDIVRANTHSTCLSVVGVGSSSLHQVYLEAITREGRGALQIAPTAASVAVCLSRVIQKIHVPTLVSVVARTEYDGNPDEVPPVLICSVAEHLSCIPIGQRAFLPCFANVSTAKPFTIIVSGMVGLHHLDYKVKSGDLRNLQQQSMTEVGRPETSSILHVNAAIHQLERITSGTDHSAVSNEERQVACALSRAFFIPSPFVGYASNSFLEGSDSTTTCVASFHSSRAQRRMALEQAGSRPAPRDATGVVAVDADEQFRARVEEAKKAAAAMSTKQFMQRRLVEEILRLAVDGGSIDDVLLAQQSDGGFLPCARLFSGLGITTDSFHSLKPADAEDEQWWATALACAWLEEASDATVAVLGATALSKGKRMLKSIGQDSLITSAKRALAR